MNFKLPDSSLISTVEFVLISVTAESIVKRCTEKSSVSSRIVSFITEKLTQLVRLVNKSGSTVMFRIALTKSSDAT